MKTEGILLTIIRYGIGHRLGFVEDHVDWDGIKTLAKMQGLSAVVLDGIEELRAIDSSRIILPEKRMLTQWIGEVLQVYEHRYKQYLRVLAELAEFYNSHGFKMMILKGYACSLNWPKPNHRPVGDIDIWQFGDHEKADKLLATEKGIEIDNSHHHHTVFYWRNFMVENHYDFINVHHHKSNVELEKELKRLAGDDSYNVKLNSEKVYLPSPNLHALFLLKHTMNDFTAFSMTLRQLLDWAFHVQKHGEEIDWKWLKSILGKYHMTDFFNCMNAICVEELGFDESIFHKVQFDPVIKERVLNDILHPKFSVKEPRHLLPRLVYKYRRWKGNAWKHQLCYNESLWSAFCSGVWNHLLKPSSL